MRAGCLEETTVLAFLDGTLRPETRSTVEEHIAACSACADVVTWAAADQASTSRLAGHEGRPFVGQLHPGARVGRYQVLGAVGRGGMGEVYAAYHPDLDRRIALKVVQGLDGDTGERRARLLREARAIARLSHPNVVTVHDAGTFGDRVFIAMELIDGRTIDQWLRAQPRTWQEVLDVFIAAGRGLAAAHAAGVIHRDFKPQNVMIGKDGSVRVMDFGLARLALEEAVETREAGEDEPTLPIENVTRTGALVGTPAYMAPEQFRREPADARSDQFSFCVALHEALFGARPAGAQVDAGGSSTDTSKPSPRTSVPGWLRSIVLRGAAADREQRFRSMEELLAALDRGRTRLRRRVSVVAVGLAVVLVSAGGWRIARGNRFACAVPQERIAAAWVVGDSGDQRRQSIHRAFAASGRDSAETSWERLSNVLDEHMTGWSAMYLQTCEATHVRGEQSAEVLDLRMSCLNDNLDQVRALTDALVTADATVVSRAVTAAKDLTPVLRCADVAQLRSAVPLPKDERTLREVQRLRRELADVEAMREVGRLNAALRNVTSLVPYVEKTGYAPLRGELLAIMGLVQASLHDTSSERTLEEAVFAAESAHDDATAAKAATSLIYVVGFDGGRLADSERWFRLAGSILDRAPSGSARTRAWTLTNLGSISVVNGRLVEALSLYEQSVVLKEQSLGKDHPDVALSLDGLAWALIHLDRPTEALAPVNRGISILTRYGDPGSPLLAAIVTTEGEALLALGRISEAAAAFERSIEILQSESDTMSPYLAEALLGLGEVDLAQAKPASAIARLERARAIYERYPGAGIMGAASQFALARSLWDGGGDRRRARGMAEAARENYASHNRSERAAVVTKWLSSHRLVR